MDQLIQTIKNKNVLIYAVVVILIGLAVGYYAGATLEKNKAEKSREAILREIFSSASFASNFSGRILEISSDKKSLIVEVPSILSVNLPKDYQEKKIIIVPETKITLIERKNDAVFGKEMKEFQNKQKTTKDVFSLIPPYPFTQKDIKVDDLEVQDSVNIGFDSEQGGKSFLDDELTALQINVNR